MKAVLSLIWQYFKKLDKQLYLAVLILGLFSVVLLYSIVQNGIIASVSPRTYKIQFISLILGSICALVLSGIDYKMIAKLWFLYVPAALILVLLLFSPLGIQREGVDDIGWLDIGFTTVQPSEFLKIAFILSFSYHLSKVYEHINRLSTVALLCLHGAFPVLLIGVTGDTGTAIVFFVIFAAMLFSAGISWKYILAALISAPLAGLFLWFKILKPVHKKRILILFDNDLDPDMFQQQRQGKIALGSGQLFGKGLFGGEYSYVPEVHNDFIFSYVGQALGFVGCMLLVGTLCFICVKIVANSRIAKDALGKYICIGVFALIFSHCVLNIGMVLGVMPVIGVPLPFTSNGGSAMLSMFICIGLVMSTYSHSGKKYAVFYDANK